MDTTTYKVLHREDKSAVQGDLSVVDMQPDEPPADPFVLLLPANIPGFGFHTKVWSKYFGSI